MWMAKNIYMFQTEWSIGGSILYAPSLGRHHSTTPYSKLPTNGSREPTSIPKPTQRTLIWQTHSIPRIPSCQLCFQCFQTFHENPKKIPSPRGNLLIALRWANPIKWVIFHIFALSSRAIQATYRHTGHHSLDPFSNGLSGVVFLLSIAPNAPTPVWTDIRTNIGHVADRVMPMLKKHLNIDTLDAVR